MYFFMGMIVLVYVLKCIEVYFFLENVEVFREELLVWWELAYNFVYYIVWYDQLSVLFEWVQ